MKKSTSRSRAQKWSEAQQDHSLLKRLFYMCGSSKTMIDVDSRERKVSITCGRTPTGFAAGTGREFDEVEIGVKVSRSYSDQSAWQGSVRTPSQFDNWCWKRRRKIEKVFVQCSTNRSIIIDQSIERFMNFRFANDVVFGVFQLIDHVVSTSILRSENRVEIEEKTEREVRVTETIEKIRNDFHLDERDNRRSFVWLTELPLDWKRTTSMRRSCLRWDTHCRVIFPWNHLGNVPFGHT